MTAESSVHSRGPADRGRPSISVVVAVVASLVATAAVAVAVTLVLTGGSSDESAEPAPLVTEAPSVASVASTTPSAPTTEAPPPTLPESITANDGEISSDELRLLIDAADQLGVSSIEIFSVVPFYGDITCKSEDGSRDFSSVEALYGSIVDTWTRVQAQSGDVGLAPWEDAWWELAAASMMCRRLLPDGVEQVLVAAP